MHGLKLFKGACVFIICSITLSIVKGESQGCLDQNIPCYRHGNCVEFFGQTCYICNCDPGYTNRCCSTDINECTSNPCHSGSCNDGVNSYTCSCNAGYTGTNCEIDTDECASQPCQSNGTCVDHINEYNCLCLCGYAGQNCEIQIDECTSGPCLNNGSCVDQNNKYKCICLNGDSGRNCEIRSQFSIRPTVMLITDKTVDEGVRVVKIPCFAEGIPTPFVKWDTVNGKLQGNIKQVGHYLVIENVTIADAGYYMCTATNREGADVKALQLQIIPKPAKQHTLPVISAPAMVQVYYYADAKLVCNVTGYPTPVIKWRYNRISQTSNGSTLIIYRVTNDTTGFYSCIATNDAGTSQANINLKVTYDPPKIISPPLPTISTAGESHNFTCRATGHPMPVILWTFDSFSRLPNGLPRHVTFDNGVVLKLVNMQESGVLTCTAENEFGSATKSAHVIVKQSTAVIG